MEVELGRSQLGVSPTEAHTPRGAVDADIADGGALRDRLGLIGVRCCAAQGRVDTGKDLADREGLRDVVVGARTDTEALGGLGVLGSDYDDRHATALPQRAAEIEAAHAGEHQVEQDQVGPSGARGAQARGSVSSFLNREASRCQVVLQHLADSFVVLDDEDSAGASIAGSAAHPSSTTWPVSRNTMSSATLVTRSEIRSRLCATSSRVTARSAPSVSVLPVPISLTRSSNTRCHSLSTSLSRPATSRARGTFWSMIPSSISWTSPLASSPLRRTPAGRCFPAAPRRGFFTRGSRTRRAPRPCGPVRMHRSPTTRTAPPLQRSSVNATIN